MDVRELAKDRLRQYIPKLAARENLREGIREQAYRRESLSGGLREIPGSGQGPKGREAMVLNSLQQQQILEEALFLTQRWLEQVERALDALTRQERQLLEQLHMQPGKGAAEQLAEALQVDVKTVYRRADQALRRFAVALWGSVEL